MSDYRLYLKPSNWPMAAGIGLLKVLHRLLPYRVKLTLCKKLGLLAYHLASKRRHVVDTNLLLCFPEMSKSDRVAFTRANFEHWGAAILETAIGWWGRDEAVTNNLTVIGAENFLDAHTKGKGVLLLGAHFSTIDLGSTLFRKHFGDAIPIHAVYRLQKNPLFNQIMIKGRLRNVSSCVSKEDMRKIVRLVRDGQTIWYAPDHDFGLANSVFVPFFGQTAATLTTTAKLAKFRHSPVVMMEHHRNVNNDGYTMEFFPALENFPAGDETQDAKSVNAALEQAILKAPEQYMWSHRRFKTQPDMAKNAIYKRET